MGKIVTFVNRKYYRPFDDSDNPCCWQVDVVARDIESLLAELGINAEGIYEDWGTAWSWRTERVIHSMQITCTDVDRPEFQVECFAVRPKWYIFSTNVADNDCDFRRIIPRLRELGDAAA